VQHAIDADEKTVAQAIVDQVAALNAGDDRSVPSDWWSGATVGRTGLDLSYVNGPLWRPAWAPRAPPRPTCARCSPTPRRGPADDQPGGARQRALGEQAARGRCASGGRGPRRRRLTVAARRGRQSARPGPLRIPDGGSVRCAAGCRHPRPERSDVSRPAGPWESAACHPTGEGDAAGTALGEVGTPGSCSPW